MNSNGKNDHDNHHQHGAASFASGTMINIFVSHGPAQHEVCIPAQHEVFVSHDQYLWDMKKIIEQNTGLEPGEQRLLFRGQEKEDSEQLHMAGVKDKSKVLLVDDPTTGQKKVEQCKESEELSRALAAVAGVRAEVDKLLERVAALEVAVNGGTEVAEEEFDVSAELLMRQLLKLDGVEAEGEAKLQRKAEVRRVQNFHETLDNLKARNSNPFSNSRKAVSVSTQWETFDSGAGSFNAPPSTSSSTEVTQDWEQFD